MRGYCFAAVVAAAFCVSGTGYGAKAPHVPGVVTESTAVIGAHIQDLSTNPVVVTNTEFDNFTPIDTVLTIDLVQDYKGKVVGTADFSSTHESGGATFNLTGKAKSSKSGPGFKLKGTAEIGGGAETKSKKVKLKVTGTLINFAGADLDPANPEITSTATYRVNVNIKGLGRNYSYTKDVELVGNYHFIFDLAPEEDVKYLKDDPKSDYYYLQTPWGTQLVDGTFQIIGADGYFTLKGPKFKFTGIDFEYDGVDFQMDFGSIKSGLGKFEGPFINADAPTEEPEAGAGAGSAVGTNVPVHAVRF